MRTVALLLLAWAAIDVAFVILWAWACAPGRRYERRLEQAQRAHLRSRELVGVAS